ncbi:tRNA uridine-5-carboxymethylaminomethyl(34) synthesis GTPase MnmE [Roseomonas marmotae]|uniref:tRNA modification GTPase MnmE n=1 Tax=Roseomonas marmotae TaxID=2768161 RepID=A0ABS3KJA7_9PROT|nr:tRNA uridine-5-carboxymethylaminomethyl(34) synthesis GTPase MnmE [Roseomonas marmotae]MBO1076698.1 tRNA uridine-5-carboxymethylaminomethyl(34) synthesis GTPase MnmE [Roseomonas marmotae]QTI79841.1 tRNA uridine-5-carboxymethylaminomethyl(34) synthesis GTPase MnmE [Roseomonas marmotae]
MTDTIFALASGAGRAAIAVLRLSGSGTGEVLRRLAGPLPPPRLASLRRLRAPGDDELLDEALVLWFPGPRSYTGEASAELHLHGGRAVLEGVSNALLALGARPAEPGEFTRRAFLNGRLDLTAAEGIADLIDAETAAQRRQALRQAGGALAERYAGWAGRLTRLLAHQEAAIEFAEEGLPNSLEDEMRAGAMSLAAEIRAHLDDGGRGERLREGVWAAIIGAPNAGKSSLLNALAGRDAAIVSSTAGTTRDVVEVRLELAGVPVLLADTAGLRETVDDIEAEGVRRARRQAEQADLVLAVFAADQTPDAETLAMVAPGVVVVANKTDLAAAPAGIGGVAPLAVSARTGAGMDRLRAALTEAVAARAGLTAEAGLTRPRHRAALDEAAGWLDEAAAAPLPELASEALRAALRALGRLTGRVGVEDVLDVVFGDFCIGK